MADIKDQQPCKDCATPSTSTNTGVHTHSHQVHTPLSPLQAVGSSVSSEIVFEPPSAESLRPSIAIEFCDRCRWAPRASWIQTELFLTFPVPILRSITLQPLTAPETGGRFRVWVNVSGQPQCVWDRKTEGGFPELKVLKQRVRNLLQPDRDLGHSDSHAHKNNVPAPGGSSSGPAAVASPAPHAGVTPQEVWVQSEEEFKSSLKERNLPLDDKFREHRTLSYISPHDNPSTFPERFRDWSLRF